MKLLTINYCLASLAVEIQVNCVLVTSALHISQEAALVIKRHCFNERDKSRVPRKREIQRQRHTPSANSRVS